MLKSTVFWLIILHGVWRQPNVSEACITTTFRGSRESPARNQQKQVASSVNHTSKIQPDICQYLHEMSCNKVSGAVAVVCMETQSVNEANERLFQLGPEKVQLHTELS